MASVFACRACRRALQQQVSSIVQATRATTPIRRNLSVSAIRSSRIPTAAAAPGAPIPPEGPAALENNDPIEAQQRQREAAAAPSHAAMSQRIAEQLRKRAGGSTETYVAYGGTEGMFRECARQADYHVERNEDGEAPKTAKGEDLGVGEGWWYDGLGLTPTFNTWAQITFLHMYALTVRIRKFPVEHAPAWHQHLIDHFFYEAENRMVMYHNLESRSIRNKYLQDLFIQWRGVIAAYDEGLIKGDAMLAAALWRNIWKAEEINAKGLATLVSYLRREIQRLDQMSDEEVTSGGVQFGDVAREEVLVEEESPQLNEPFTLEEEPTK